MYCKRCGLELPQDAVFCPQCGLNLEENGVLLNNSPTYPDSALSINEPSCPMCHSYNVQIQANRKPFNPFIIIISMFVYAILFPVITTVLAALITEAIVGATAMLEAAYSAAIVSIPVGIILGIIVSVVGCVRRSQKYDSVFVCQNCGYSLQI